jgi:four helix bundle protein
MPCIAEGAGEFSRADKQRFYRMARRSATESAATLDIIARRKHAPAEMLSNARSRLVRVVSMLVRMTQSSPKR